MAKRKLGASIIILCIAAVTLISGTYAWFLVGGFAELFDIGFDVIEATGGLLLRGDAGTSENKKNKQGDGTTDGWGKKLERDDFTEFSFIVGGANPGKYKPVSSKDGTNFISVELNGKNEFVCNGFAVGKQNTSVENFSESQICYNDFTFSIKASAEEIPSGAYMTIELSGEKYDETTGEKIKDDPVGAAVAARVSVTIAGINNDNPIIYSYDGQEYTPVTNTWKAADGKIIDAIEEGKDQGNYIIDGADTGYDLAINNGDKFNPTSLVNDDGSLLRIPLGSIPGKDMNSGNGKPITIRIWLEGNDPDCISFGDGALMGKSLLADIEFNVEQ